MKIDSPNILSELSVSGSAEISGSLNVLGAISSSGNIVPTTSTQDLGTIDNPWREIFVTTGSIKFVDDGEIVKTLTADNLVTTESLAQTLPEGVVSGSSQVSYSGLSNIPAGIVSGSQQLTGSYDQRYVLSGSITQTTWDNIDSKPAGIVSSSAQIQLDQVSGTTFGTADFTFPQDLTVQGRLTAQEFNTELISSSIIYESGSTKFGDSADDVHSFTGSVQVFGSITGSLLATNGILSSSAQIASEISGSFNSVSQSIASDIASLFQDSGSFSTRVSGLESFSASLDSDFVSETEFASASGSFLVTASVSDDTLTLTKGDGSTFNLIVDNVENATSASYVDWIDVDNIPAGIVSGSSQVSYSGLSDIPTGIISGSSQLNNSTLSGMTISGSFSGSYQGDGSQLTGLSPFPFTGSAGISGSLTVNGTVTATTIVETSSETLKENIANLQDSLQNILNLRPVTFNRIGSDRPEVGFIAEEVNQIYPQTVVYNDSGQISGIEYSRLTAPLVKAVQELTQIVHILNEKVNG
jgi:hypothetical protein